jgi:hypothetical protein
MINFLGIGAHKCGTTWLFEHLSRHPDILFPGSKEIHFWDKQRHLGVQWWLNLFPNSVDGKKTGEITPAYAILEPAVIREIYAVCPEVSLFMSLRNPMARMWSAALQGLDRAKLKFDETSDQWFLDYFHSNGARRRGNYLECIDNWNSVFPQDRLQIVWFDDIVSRPNSVLQSLATHIGVDPAYYSARPLAELQAAIHEGQKQPIRGRLLEELRSIYLPKIDELAARFDRDIRSWRDWPNERILTATLA